MILQSLAKCCKLWEFIVEFHLKLFRNSLSSNFRGNFELTSGDPIESGDLGTDDDFVRVLPLETDDPGSSVVMCSILAKD